MLIEYLL